MKRGGWAKLCCLPCCASGVRHEWACPWKTLNLWLKWCLQRFVSFWSLGPCVCIEVSSQATARRVFLLRFCCLLWFVIVSFFFSRKRPRRVPSKKALPLKTVIKDCHQTSPKVLLKSWLSFKIVIKHRPKFY